MRKIFPRVFTIIVLFVYLFTVLFQQVPFLRLFDKDKVFAEAPSEKINIVLLLTDSELYKWTIKTDIDWYAKDYIQSGFPNTKALILPLDVKTIKSYDIVKMIQNLYFDGQKDATTDLQGIVLLGNVPLPVIEKESFLMPSIYPYVDVENPSFVYDKSSKYFKYNGKVGEVDIWHSIIQFDRKYDYQDFFLKLKLHIDRLNWEVDGEKEDWLCSKMDESSLDVDYTLARNNILVSDSDAVEQLVMAFRTIWYNVSLAENDTWFQNLINLNGTLYSVRSENPVEWKIPMEKVWTEDAPTRCKVNGNCPSPHYFSWFDRASDESNIPGVAALELNPSFSDACEATVDGDTYISKVRWEKGQLVFFFPKAWQNYCGWWACDIVVKCPKYTVTYKVPTTSQIHASWDLYPGYSFVPEYTCSSTDYWDNSNLEEGIYLEDFEEAKDSVNENNIVYYLNKTIWAEDMSYGRLTKALVNYMKTHNEDRTKSVMKDFSKGLEAGEVATTEGNETTDVLFGMDKWKSNNFESIQNWYNAWGAVFNTSFVKPTEEKIDTNNEDIKDTKENVPNRTLKSATDKYTKNYSSIFGGWYGDKLRTQLETSERYSWDNTNNAFKLIDLKDKLAVDFIKSTNMAMEKLVDEQVDQGEYYMKRLVMHENRYAGRSWYERSPHFDRRKETFYFGFPARDLEEAKDLTILRWTYGNYEDLSMMGETDSVHNWTTSDSSNSWWSGSGRPIFRFSKPGNSYCGWWKAYINVECGDSSTTYTVPNSWSRFEWDDDLLWKPSSESDGNLVILLPEKFPSNCNTNISCDNSSSVQEAGEYQKRYQWDSGEVEDDWETSEERVQKTVWSSFGFNNLQTQSNRWYNFVNGGCQEDKMTPPENLDDIEWLDWDISEREEKSYLSVWFRWNKIVLNQDITTLLASETGWDKETVANPWIIFPKNCKRYASTFERMRPNQTIKLDRAVAWDHIKHFDIVWPEWRPTEGVTYGFVVSGLVRNGTSNQKIRSKIAWVERGKGGDSGLDATWDITKDYFTAIEWLDPKSSNALHKLASKLREMGYEACPKMTKWKWIDKMAINGTMYDVRCYFACNPKSWNKQWPLPDPERKDEAFCGDSSEAKTIGSELEMEDKYLIDTEHFPKDCSKASGDFPTHKTCTDAGKHTGDETIPYWAGRIYGWYSIMNINQSSISGWGENNGSSKGNLNKVRFSGAGWTSNTNPYVCVSTWPMLSDGWDYKKARYPVHGKTGKNWRLWDLAGTVPLQKCEGNYPLDNNAYRSSNYWDGDGAVYGPDNHLCWEDPQAYYSVDAYWNYRATWLTEYWCGAGWEDDRHFHNYPNAPGEFVDFIKDFDFICPPNRCEIFQFGDVIEVIKCAEDHDLWPYEEDFDGDGDGTPDRQQDSDKDGISDFDQDSDGNGVSDGLEWAKSKSRYEKYKCPQIDHAYLFNFWDTRLEHKSPNSIEFNNMELPTLARPIDSIRYINFQWVWWDEVKLEYPDLWQVKVYDWGKLLEPEKIAENIKEYLEEVANNYIDQLQWQLDKSWGYCESQALDGRNEIGGDIWWKVHGKDWETGEEGAELATKWDALEPLASPCDREYEIPESDFLYKAIGDDVIASIAESLYWMNLWWSDKSKQPTDIKNRDMEIDYYYDDFEPNEKIDYISKNMTSGDPYTVNWVNLKNNVVNFPDFPQRGYEAWFIGSTGEEKLTWSRNESRDDTPTNTSSDHQNSKFTKELMEDTQDAEDCWVSSDGTVPLWDWPDAISCRLDETLSKPFEIKNTSECSWDSEDEFEQFGYHDKENLSKILAANKKVSCSKENNDIIYVSNKEAEEKKLNKADKDRYAFYSEVNSKLLIRVNDTFFTNAEYTGNITLEWDTNNLDITAYSDGVTCIRIKQWNTYKNLCDGVKLDPNNNWKYPISFYNLDNNKWKDTATKSGDRYLNFKICKTSNPNLCIWKTIILEKIAGDIKYIDITPYSNSMIWGGTMPVVIKAYDKNPNIYPNANEVTAVPYSYNITIDPNLININKGITPISDTSFGRDEKVFWLKAATNQVEGVDKFTLSLDLAKEWKEMYPNVLKHKSYTFNIYNKKKLEDSEVTLTPSLSKKYFLPNDPYELVNETLVNGKSYGIYSYNKAKLVKLHIEPKLPNGTTLKDTLTIKDINGIFVAGTIKNTETSVLSWTTKSKITHLQFYKKDKFLIDSDDGIDIRLVPTLRTGVSKIKISIPWMDDYYIYYKVYSPGVSDIDFDFEKSIIEEGESVEWHIKLLDSLGNIVSDSYKLDDKWNYSNQFEWTITLWWGLTFVDGTTVKKFITSDWLYDFTLSGKEEGYATVKASYFEKGVKKTIEKSKEIKVRRTSISIKDNLNIMYLSIFGSNWWKEVKEISSKSDTNLAITTMIEDPKMLKQYNFIFHQDFRITDNLWIFKKLFFENGDMKVDLWKDSYKADARFILKNTMNFKVNQIKTVEDIPIEDIKDGVEIYYLPEPVDDIITSNNIKHKKLYINNKKVIDIDSGWQANDINIKYDIIAQEDHGYSAWQVYQGKNKLLWRFFIKASLPVEDVKVFVRHKLKRIIKKLKNIFSKQISNVSQINSINKENKLSLYYLPSSSAPKNYLKDNKFYVETKNSAWQIVKKKYIDINSGDWNDSIKAVYDSEIYTKYGYPARKIYLNNTYLGTFFLEAELYLDNYSFLVNTVYWEWTTNGIKWVGFYSYDQDEYPFQPYDSVEKYGDPDMKIGFDSDFRNITDWAWGLTVWEATKNYASEFVINFGDPFLKASISPKDKKNEDENNTDTEETETIVQEVEWETSAWFLDFNSNIWDNIFTDINGSIKKVLTIDFNKDGLKDILIVYKNNSIRLLKKYKWTRPFKDIWDLMVMPEGIKDIFVGDATGDGFDDIFVLLKNDSFRYYKNEWGKFDLQGFPVCLDISGWPDDLNIEQIYAKYIDNDKKIDFVVNDKQWSIKTFYGDTYISTDIMKCDKDWKTRLKQKTIKNYGLKINKDVKFIDDGYIYRNGLNDKYKEEQKKVKAESGGSISIKDPEVLSKMAYAHTRDETLPFDQANYLQENKDKFAFQEFPSEYWPANEATDETAEFNFKKAIFLDDSDPISIYKTMKKVYEWKEYEGGILSGDITILKAQNESNITDYVLYWGSSSYEKLVWYDAIDTIPKTWGDLKYKFKANTKIPSLATHLLVYTKNKKWEMATAKSVVILQMWIPRKLASGVWFTNITINNANTLSGKLRVLRSQDESNITDYVLYWGKDKDKKLKWYDAITTLKKTWHNIDYNFIADRIPQWANYILVYSKNTYGESTEWIWVPILEKKNANIKAGGIRFVDQDTGAWEIAGVVDIQKASNESNITDYVLYWGVGPNEKYENQPIKIIPKTGNNLKYVFNKNTKIPKWATYLLVYTKNKYWEMFEWVSTLIKDVWPPTFRARWIVMTEDLYPWDIVKITIHLNGSWKKFTYLEALKWPFEIQKNQNGEVPLEFDVEDSDAIVSYIESYPKFLFKLDNFSGREVSYYARYTWESPVNTVLDDETGNIKIYAEWWCSKWFEEYDGNSVKYTDLKAKLEDKVAKIQWDRDEYVGDVIQDSEEKKFWNLMNRISSVWYNENSTFSSDKIFSYDGWSTISISDEALTEKFEWAKEVVDKTLGWLCKWFWFGAWECGNVSIPCNMAFLSPGITNICGCPLKKDYGVPVFYYPWTLYIAGVPVPIPNMLKNWAKDKFYWADGWKYDSFIRIYLSPTLTQWLWLAVCFGDYGKSMKKPKTPFGTIMGNCIVVAGNIPLPGCNSGWGEDSWYGSPSGDSDNSIEDRMNDLLNMGSCNQVPGASWSHNYPSTALTMWWGSSYSSSSMYSDMPTGTVEVNGETAVKFETNAHTINSEEDVDTLLEWWVPITLKILSGNSKWLVKCIVQKWWNRQLEFIISNFTSMTIYIIYPDLDNITEWFKELLTKLKNTDTLLENTFDSTTKKLKSAIKDLGIWESKWDATSKIEKELSKITPAAKWLKTLWEALSNPFEDLKSYFESIPLVDMQTQTLVVQIPWIGKDEVSRQIAYLKWWKERNQKIVEARKHFSVSGSAVAQFEDMVASVDKNIEILYEYVDFPKEVYKYLHLLDYYFAQIMCIIEKLVNMIVGRLDTNSRRFEKWVDTIILLMAIIDTWQILIDFSVNWKTSCGQCKQDNADLHDCILSIFCFDLPVLPIPPFKIPDITIDLSHINLGIDILLPELKIKPVAIDLFQLPDLPEIPPLAWEVSVKMPEVPLLPEPPDLVLDLFELPEVPYIKLPNLPPAPKLPALMPTIKVVLNILKVIARYYCIIKNGIWLVAEWDSKSRIEQLTQRRNRVNPFDFLKINFPSLPYKWVDLKIDGYMNFRIKLDQIYNLVESFTEDINDKTNKQIWEIESIDYDYLNIDIPGPLDGVDTTIEKHVDLDNSYKENKKIWEQAWKRNVHKKMELAQATKVLYDELDFFIWEFDKDYMRTTSTKLQTMAIKVQNMISRDKNVQANQKWVIKIWNEVKNKIQAQKDNISRIEEMLKRLEQWDTDILNEYNDIIYKDSVPMKKVNLLSEISINKDRTVYKTPLFTMDKKYINLLDKAKSPKVSYLEINKKMLAKLSKKVDEKVKSDSSYMVAKHKIDKTLNLIDAELQIENHKKKVNYVTSSENKLPPADPTNNIRGLYVKWENTDNYYSVMSNKTKAQQIRRNRTYFLEDINGDNKKDLLWWDAQHVYVKYKWKWEKIKIEGTTITNLYSYKNTIKKVEDEIDAYWYIKVNGDKFKIWSESQSNSTLQVRWQDPETVRLTWEADKNTNTNAYLIVYSNRIDILDDIEKRYNYNSDIIFDEREYKGWAVLYYDSLLNKQMIPQEKWKDTDFTEVKLPSETEKYDIFRDVGTNMEIMPVRDFPRLKNHVAILHNIWNKDWDYFRVYPVRLTVYGKDKFKIENLSMYSNQVVWWSQVSSDDTSPDIKVTLKKYNKVWDKYEIWEKVWEWLFIDANVNTRYILELEWTDNLWEIRTSYLLDEHKKTLCKDCALYGTWDFDKIMSSYPWAKKYFLIWEDMNDNVTNIELVINYKAPNLSIEDVDIENGRIIADIADKMDNPMVKFLRDRDGEQKFIENQNLKNYFTGVDINGKEIVGSTFNTNPKITFYNDNGDKSVSLWWVDISNGNIYINPKYSGIITKSVDFRDQDMKINIYKNNKALYRFNLPGKKLVKNPSIFDGLYKLQAINSENMENLNGGWCVLDIIKNQCAMYIGLKGNVYVPDEYKNLLVWQHYYNSDIENITIKVYKGSLLSNELFEWTYKVWSE